MITGIGVFFSSFCVCALNALQNSMLWGRERRGPEPMGGDGSAAPAGTCNFRYPVTFFAILFSLLVVRRLTAGDRPHLPRLKRIGSSGWRMVADAFPIRHSQ